MTSSITHLECTACGDTFSDHDLHTTCPSCAKVLFARYDLDALRQTLTKVVMRERPADMWRWRELLPVRDPAHVLTLGEGGTPLLHATRLGRDFGASHVYIKEEGLNPTGSFKARGLSAAVSKAHELGVRRISIPTAGNAGAAVSAYGAKAGMEVHVFMPADTPELMKREPAIYGATVHLVDGLISDAGKALREAARREGWFDVSTLKEPYRVEGKKTMGLELAEQFDWELPDAILYPTGGGTGIVGMWKAFEELESMGWIGSQRPRMISVQAAGCAPIVRAFEAGDVHAEPWEDAHTIAAGLRVPSAIGDYLMLQAIRDSGGVAIAVSDDEILVAMRDLARVEGLFAAPEGAATLAGYKRLIADGRLSPDDRVVLFNTGSGLKTPDLIP